MANYQNLEAYMKSRVYENNDNAISGQSMQDVLDMMIQVLGFGYQFGGIATPDGEPEGTDAKVFYLATQPGTYTNYGGVELAAQRLGVITYGEEWAIYAIPMLSSVNTDDIVNAAVTASKIASDAVETSKIKDGAVTTDKIADEAVTTSKVADKAVNLEKLGDDVKTVFDELGGFIVENAEESTIEAQSKHLYNVTADVDELSITLPTPKEGYTDEVKVHFVAGDEPELNIIGGDIPVYRSGVAPKPHKEYMLTLRYNGLSWIATADCLTPADCLTFQSADPFALTILRKGWDGSFEYSTDANTWHDVEVNTAIESASNGLRNVLYLRGHGNTTISNFTLVTSDDMFMSMEGANIHCVGDIRTLLNYKDAATATMSYRSFWRLFDSCTALISAPELPSLIMAEDCYRRMFHGSGITIAPELPATTLADTCYDNMFGKCSALVSAPAVLPATSLTFGCYNLMFSDCAALISAPKLPATELAESCYTAMFAGCTALAVAPELPATELAVDCYYEMFYNCTSLLEAPNLPATTLGYRCYKMMFQYCTSLISAPAVLPATALAEECYRSMFAGCAALTAAPELPATVLAISCYRGMFTMTGITTAPDLPATVLVKDCYRTMFQNAPGVSSVKMLATDISAADCLLNWLNGVAAEGVITKDAAMTTLPSGASGIPNGWTTVDA